MSNTVPPILPVTVAGGVENEDPATTEVDGEEVLDPDANDEIVDSAEADRLAAEGDPEPESR